MPLFISEEEFRSCADDPALLAEKADAFIRELYNQIETVKAEAEAASITLEQTCALNEQKYVSLSSEYSSFQLQHSELNASLEQRTSELAKLQAEKQQLLLHSIEKDGEIERLTMEASELHKSKKQLMELLEQRDLEISEKTATVKSYLDKIVNLTENGASKDAVVADLESELGRLRATSARLLQEKELLERHNSWLNDELTSKVDSLIQLRKDNGELESDMSAKLVDVEHKMKESSSSLKFYKDRVRELEEKLSSTERELLSTKDASAAAEEHSSAEISTVTKLVDLYKESSEEWSKKARELEGVIKALETHLNQVESEYKDKLEKEVSSRKEIEKEATDLKEKLQNSILELDNLKKGNELKDLPLSSFTFDSWLNTSDAGEMVGDDRAIVPKIPAGVSGTALAASLLRDGWTLAKIYAKYQEAADALRHEQLGRKQSQAILERVLYEIEEKAAVIMDERVEHERFLEVYSALDQKLQQTLSEHSALEFTIQELKASLKRQERDYAVSQKEIFDLQKQVSVLLKECRDVQLRCGSAARYDDELTNGSAIAFGAERNAENIISDRLLTFKDINGLVEQNVQLRSLAHSLSDQIEEKEAELKDKYEKELQVHTNETASKVNAVLSRAEEQTRMIESLHTSVAMYKKLYEEEQKLRSRPSCQQEIVPEQGSKEVLLLQESNHDSSRMVQEQAFQRLKNLEEELSKSKNDIISLRSEREKLALEARFAEEKLGRFMKDFEHQREEHNGVIARNIEFSRLIIDYQKKLRESAESLNAANELSTKLTMEVSILKHEKEILQNSEKRAFDEVRSLSERVHRLQVSLDTIKSTEEVHEEARGIDRRKQEEYINKIEREWAEAKSELQQERNNFRSLTLERESALKDVLRQVEELSKGLSNALQSVADAESRAAVAEARCSDLENMMESASTKDHDGAEGGPPSSTEKILANFRSEIEKLREEAHASENHMIQYKRIAQVNEDALKQMELSHETFKNEADEVKRSLEHELHSLRERVSELESECKLKTEEAISATVEKKEALAGALSEIASVKDYYSDKMSQIEKMESEISALKEDLDREHKKWRTAQDNYERQVILQSETIQELTKTSEALASVQQEAYELRKVVDVLKIENDDLKQKWETERVAIEVYKNEADKKYNEVDELNKILHSRLEALHIKIAERERGITSGSSTLNIADDDGLQIVMSYLRRSKEIAETEISLLKQEKLRLQSQLESALKSAETAQASLQADRAKSRSPVFMDEEFKTLQLQIRELNLLRESNVQLREENRHNFEECQKLRAAFQNVKFESENLEKLLRDRDNELEAYRKEVQNLKTEKLHLEKRIDELMERCKDIDIDDYNRLKETCQQIQMKLREKDAEFEEIKKLLSEKQDTISLLERDLTRSKAELLERETRINEIMQAEASLKSEVEKFKRLNLQVRRKSENLVKEKDEMSKEIQSLSKQLEEAKQVKRNTADSVWEQTLKEKDTRIQILEKTLERYKEELRKEREDHQKEKERNSKIRKTIVDSKEIVTQEKKKLSDELEKHKKALQAFQDEVEKLKNQSEITSAVQELSTTLLDASPYLQAVDNFEQVAQPACGDHDSASTDAPSLDKTTGQAATSSSQAAMPLIQTQAMPAANVPSMRINEEKDRRAAVAKANLKTGRKLVRPNITKPKEPQGDVEMLEADGSNTGLPSHNTENQGNVTVPATAFVRKRSSASFSSDIQEETLAPEEPGLDVPAPLLKKPKASESMQEGGEESGAPMKLPEVVAIEESSDDMAKLQQSSDKEECVDTEKDEFETGGEPVEEPSGDEQIQAEQPSDTVDVADDKPSDTMLSDDQLRDQTEQDIQPIVSEAGGEREEGELDADFADNDGDSNISNEMGPPETGEVQGEQSIDPEKSPSSEPLLEVGEIDPSQAAEEESIFDGSDKVSAGADPNAEPDQAPSSSTNVTAEEPSASPTADVGSSEQGGPTVTQDKPVSPLNSGSTTINLHQRAKQRAPLRQAGINPPLNSSPVRARGRGIRGRAARGGRTGRGQSPG
ncbi:hypothetical protein ACS0TY_032908 [Phlomoides rotata]